MSRRGVGRWALAAGLVTIAALPSTAAARPPVTFIEAKLPATGQFRVLLTGVQDQVMIDLTGPSGRAGYAVQGTVKPRRISGDFEQFGTVDLRFQPRGKPLEGRLPPECKGTFTLQRGTFVGTFSLHEEGLVSVNATRLRGSVTRDNVRCGAPEFPDNPQQQTEERDKFTEVMLEASDSRGAYGTQLFVTHRTDRKPVHFEAYRSRLIGGVSTYAGTSAVGPRSSFAYDLRNGLATVQPPAPFAGTAQLGHDDYGVPTWTGDLSLSLFGGTPLPLTGGTFQAALNRSRVTVISVAVGTGKRELVLTAE